MPRTNHLNHLDDIDFADDLDPQDCSECVDLARAGVDQPCPFHEGVALGWDMAAGFIGRLVLAQNGADR